MDQSEALLRLRVGGIVAIVAIAVLALAQALLIQWRFTTSPLWARIAERSGQRTVDTLSAVYYAERLADGSHELSAYRSALGHLAEGQSAFHDFSPQESQKFAHFMSDATTFERHPDPSQLTTLEAQASALIAHYRALSAHYAQGGDLQRRQFRRNALIDSAALLTVLSLLYLFVIRPSQLSIREMLIAADQSEQALLTSRERFRSLFEQSPNAIASVSADGTIHMVNVRLEHLTGYFAEELIGKPYTVLIPTERHDLVNDRLALLLTGRSVQYDGVIRCKDGTLIEVEADSAPIRVAGALEGIYIIMRDLVVNRALERRLEDKDERVRALYLLASSSTEVGMLIDDALSFGVRALDLSFGFVVRFDGSAMTVLHRYGDSSLLPVDFQMPFTQSIGARLAASPRAFGVEDLSVEPYAIEMIERDLPWKCYIGCRIFVENAPFGALVFTGTRAHHKPFGSADRDLVDLIGSLVGTAVRREMAQTELQEFAFRDVLTGLANRRVLDDRTNQALAYARRSGKQVAIHYIDLDDLKTINDIRGHRAGDEVLVEVARRFTQVLREQDLIARVGGDEFVVLQTAIAGPDDIATLSQRLRASLALEFVLASGTRTRIEASFGVAVFPDEGTSLDALIQAADGMMYQEKQLHHANRPNGNSRSDR